MDVKYVESELTPSDENVPLEFVVERSEELGQRKCKRASGNHLQRSYKELIRRTCKRENSLYPNTRVRRGGHITQMMAAAMRFGYSHGFVHSWATFLDKTIANHNKILGRSKIFDINASIKSIVG